MYNADKAVAAGCQLPEAARVAGSAALRIKRAGHARARRGGQGGRGSDAVGEGKGGGDDRRTHTEVGGAVKTERYLVSVSERVDFRTSTTERGRAYLRVPMRGWLNDAGVGCYAHCSIYTGWTAAP